MSTCIKDIFKNIYKIESQVLWFYMKSMVITRNLERKLKNKSICQPGHFVSSPMAEDAYGSEKPILFITTSAEAELKCRWQKDHRGYFSLFPKKSFRLFSICMQYQYWCESPRLQFGTNDSSTWAEMAWLYVYLSHVHSFFPIRHTSGICLHNCSPATPLQRNAITPHLTTVHGSYF